MILYPWCVIITIVSLCRGRRQAVAFKADPINLQTPAMPFGTVLFLLLRIDSSFCPTQMLSLDWNSCLGNCLLLRWRSSAPQDWRCLENVWHGSPMRSESSRGFFVVLAEQGIYLPCMLLVPPHQERCLIIFHVKVNCRQDFVRIICFSALYCASSSWSCKCSWRCFW